MKMNVPKRILAISIILIFNGQFISCEENDKTEFKSFLIQVDSVVSSKNLPANNPINIKFYG